ncbi:MAG: hypothetical protein OEZ36_07605 [Spirochaetota bacterium]|nr:hypothetical protein [Spirochaetota bacterium]
MGDFLNQPETIKKTLLEHIQRLLSARGVDPESPAGKEATKIFYNLTLSQTRHEHGGSKWQL